MWDFATGQEYVAIQQFRGDELIKLIAEIPLSCLDAEKIAETICGEHNASLIAEALRRP
jgi:hypothetical protein